MNWKEMIGGAVVTASLTLFTLWTTEGEINSKSGFIVAMIIIFLMSCVWRVLLNPFISVENISWKKIKSYSIGALVASVVAVMVGI